MLFWLTAAALAADTAPLQLLVEDPRVRAVRLTCDGVDQEAPVKDGVASFARASNGCSVTMIRSGGTITSPGRWTCTLDTCVQEDVHHLPVSDAAQRVNVIVTTPMPAGTGLEVNCPDGQFRERVTLTENTAVFDHVPSQECTLLFKGGVPAKYAPLKYGTYYCSLTGATAVCTLQ